MYNNKYKSPKPYAFKLLESVADSTIDTVMSGKQSPADNIRTIATFVAMCDMVQSRFDIGNDELPPELCKKLELIDILLSTNIAMV